MGQGPHKRYFYGHTSLDGTSFRYVARPGAILRGRLLVLIVFAVPATYAVWTANTPMQWAILGLAALVAPWVIVRSLRFNARCSEYRAIRFDFRGTLTDAAVIFWGWGLVFVITAGLGYPLFKARFLEFVARSHRYGERAFEADALTEPMLGAFAKCVAFGAIAFFAGVFVSFAAFEMVGLPYALAYGHLPFMVMYATAQLYVVGVFKGWTTNAFWRFVRLGDLHIRSSLSPWRLGVLYVSNAYAILATLGLATPWAALRTYRYRVESLEVTSGPIDVASVGIAPEGTLGAAAQDGFALDLGI